VIAQTAFMISTYASYARKDTRSPLGSMILQAAACLALVATTLLVHGSAVLLVLGLAYSASVTLGALHLTMRLFRRLGSGSERIWPSLVKVTVGAAAMAGPAWLTATTIATWTAGPLGQVLAMLGAALVGAAVYLGIQALLKTPELGWITAGLNDARPKVRRRTAEVRHG
jgi:peptidoglycan biosynthesis protein MviN/MurJ (putative lipid II flippase)